MKHLNKTVILGILLFTATAYADNKVEAKSESTDAAGTTVKIQESSEHKVDSDGNVKVESHYNKSTDPKGLANKTKEKSHSEVERKANGEYKETTESVDAHGTAHKYNAEKKIDNHLDGGKTTTVESSDVVDPKGLMNKKSAEIKEEVRRNAEGAVESKTVTKKINGKVVSETTEE